MSLEIARNTMRANLKKVAAKDVPFLYAQSASDKKPVLLVGELGRNLPGPVVAEVKKGATGVVTGFVNKGSEGLEFRVRTGTIASGMPAALKLLVKDEAPELKLTKAAMVAEPKPSKEKEQQEEGETLSAVSSLLEKSEKEAEEEQKRRLKAWAERLAKFDKRFNAAEKTLRESQASLNKLGLKNLIKVVNVVGHVKGDRRGLDGTPNDEAAAALEKALPAIEAAAGVAEDVTGSILALNQTILQKEIEAKFAQAVTEWKRLQVLLCADTLDQTAIESCIGRLAEVEDLTDRTDGLRRRMKWVTTQLGDSAHDVRNETLMEFAIKTGVDIGKVRLKIGVDGAAEAKLVHKLEDWLDKTISRLQELKPESSKAVDADDTYTEAKDGTLVYKGNAYVEIHTGVWGFIDPDTCKTKSIYNAYKQALTNGVISTYGTGEAGVKKKGNSWEIKVRRDRCESLGLGTSARIDGKVTNVPKIGGGTLKFVLFDTFFDAH